MCNLERLGQMEIGCMNSIWRFSKGIFTSAKKLNRPSSICQGPNPGHSVVFYQFMLKVHLWEFQIFILLYPKNNIHFVSEQNIWTLEHFRIIFDSIQDLNVRLDIQTEIQLWALIKNCNNFDLLFWTRKSNEYF